MENKACAKSEVDLDADEIILQQCIELGMPKQSPANVVPSLASKTVECLPANVKTNPSQVIVLSQVILLDCTVHIIYNTVKPQTQKELEENSVLYKFSP